MFATSRTRLPKRSCHCTCTTSVVFPQINATTTFDHTMGQNYPLIRPSPGANPPIQSPFRPGSKRSTRRQNPQKPFIFFLLDTVRSSITSVCAHSFTIFPGNDKTSMTTKFHVVFVHASPRRTRTLLKYHGTEISSELPCVCQICASVKSSAPSRRKYEHRHVSVEEVIGNHFESTNMDIQHSIDEMTQSDERSAQYEKLPTTPKRPH